MIQERTSSSIFIGTKMGVMILFAVYFLFPLYWVFVSITKTNTQLFGTFGLWFPPELSIGENLRDLFARGNGIFTKWFLNSIIYSTSSALLGGIVATLAGYGLSSYEFRGKETIFIIILGCTMVPFAALVLPLFLIVRSFGWINTYQSIIFPAAVSSVGVYFMRIYIQQAFPSELIDAARVDGASEFKIFWSIVFKIIIPGFITVFLVIFVAAWNNFFLPLVMLSKSKLFPTILGLAVWNSTSGFGGELLYTIILTGAVISVLPMIGLFLYLQKYWQSGLMAGSVK